MISCQDITEKTSYFIDGKLSLWQRLQWWMHLLICHHCRQFVRQFRLTIASVAGLAKEQHTTLSDPQLDALAQQLCRHHHDHNDGHNHHH